VTHTRDIPPDKIKKPYILIQAGSSLAEPIGYLTDDSGDNISEKNPKYCELTALYWIWKNDKTSNIVGMTHYRRFFYIYNLFSNTKRMLNQNDILKYLDEYDIILPDKQHFGPYTVKKQFAEAHGAHKEDKEEDKTNLMKCREIINKICPKYTSSFDEVMEQHSLYCYNMFITRKGIFDQYMSWLFGILDKAEEIIDLSIYDDLPLNEKNYQYRVYGFLAERLFNVWLCKNSQLKRKEVMVLTSKKNEVTGVWEDEKINRRDYIGRMKRKYYSTDTIQKGSSFVTTTTQRREALIEGLITPNSPRLSNDSIDGEYTTKTRANVENRGREE
ncbi:MAG TPA: hypothetical protein DEP51_06245, partial [Clostridiales bacterium]|nr:hypothetical protein [Clostridiales bacterium]